MAALVRTLSVTLVLAGLILLVFWRLSIDQRQQSIDELTALNEKLHDQLRSREAMVRRLSTSRRIAMVEVLDQYEHHGGGLVTSVRFIEIDERGNELARQQFQIPGDVLFIDAWTVKFDHDHVAEGHPLHGRSLVLLRRIYSDRMAPMDGFAIDTPGAIPPGYAAEEVGRYEQRIWANFWELATDAAKARSMGVRVAQGEAAYKPVRPGQRYELMVDAVGGISLTPLEGSSSRISQATGN